MKLSELQIKHIIPVTIEAGLGLFTAAKWLHIGGERLKRLATESQVRDYQRNALKNQSGGIKAPELQLLAKKPDAFLVDFIEPENVPNDTLDFKEQVQSCIDKGLGVAATIAELQTSHKALHQYATEKQIIQLKQNGRKRQGHSGPAKKKVAIKRSNGMSVFIGFDVAQTRMREILKGAHL